MEEGKSIPLNLQELEEIIEIYERVQTWLAQARKEIERGVQLDLIEELFKAVIVFILLFEIISVSQEKSGKVYKELEKMLLERDKHIFKLILESIYFPVEIEETNTLLLILQKRDFARSLMKV